MTWIGDVNITINNGGDDSEQKATIETAPDHRAPINYRNEAVETCTVRAAPLICAEQATVPAA
jgi:hypothetical protein